MLNMCNVNDAHLSRVRQMTEVQLYSKSYITKRVEINNIVNLRPRSEKQSQNGMSGNHRSIPACAPKRPIKQNGCTSTHRDCIHILHIPTKRSSEEIECHY